MPTPTPGLDHILYGFRENETGTPAHPAPSSATLLVSLFLILITFFVIINKNAHPDAAKRKAVLESMQEKFGGPTDDLQAFGGVVQPKLEEFTLQLQRVLGKDAMVESTINGDATKVTFAKELFFYADETEMRTEKIQRAQQTSEVLKNLMGGKDVKISIIMGLENYDLDVKKLTAFKNALGITEAEAGFATNSTNKITLVINNE